MAAMPAGVAQSSVLDLTLANTYHDFEDGPQGWTALPGLTSTRPAPTASWQWGAPTSGPKVAASGANVWATNLAGNYTVNECSGLMTPPIDLTAATSASIAFKHWRHFELSSTTGTAWDGGTMMVTADGGATFTDVTATGYNTNTPGSTVRTCWDAAPTTARGYAGPVGTTIPAPTYATSSLDLTAFAGQVIQVVFAFGSDGSNNRAGWYVDDVATTIDGVTTTQDFEGSDGGFSMVGTKVAPAVAQGWSHGVPTTGPGNATAMWATNLHGNPGPSECHWVESSPIDLTDFPAESGAALDAMLTWNQWFRTSSNLQAGVVQIGTAEGYTNVAPTDGYIGAPTSTVLDACLGHLATGLGAFTGLIDAVGGPMTEFEADITEFLGQTITVRFLFASTTSTPTNPGWYVDDVNVEVALVVDQPSIDDLPIPSVPKLGDPTEGQPLAGLDGWRTGGPNNTWAYGTTTTAPIGQTVLKTNLNGNHHANECSFVETPPIAGVSMGVNPSLRFEHWHRIPGTSVNVPWAAGIVLVSADGGLTWAHLDMGDYNKEIYQEPSYTEIYNDCLAAWGADIDGGGYGKASTSVPGNVGGFYTSTADLSAYAAAPQLKIRFAFASDGTFAYEGWALRSVELGDVKVL